MSIRSSCTRLLLAVAAVTMLLGASSSAQQSSSDEGKRKIKTRVSPPYPDLARRMNISGKVKIEVTISPDGHVRSWRAIGGNPVLVQACLDVIKDWKFMPAPEETTQIVEFEFRRTDGSAN